jgi:hypothetical protein
MYESAGIKVQACVPIVDENGEPFEIRIWTWWQDEIRHLMDALPGSQGPWTTRTERFRWLMWLVISPEQLAILKDFFERTRREFGLAQLYFEYHPLTFGIVDVTEQDS